MNNRKYKKDKGNTKNIKNRENREIKEFKKDDESKEEYIVGINAVDELLKSESDINKIWVIKGNRNSKLETLLLKAKDQNATIVYTDKVKLDNISKDNQGIIASVNPFSYVDVEEILELAKSKKESPFILILDKITDVQNLGAIIRSAEAAGVHGIIIPKRNSASITSSAYKTSAGAIMHMKIARVSNLINTINMLKERGLWIIGTDLEAKSYHTEVNLTGSVAIVIGNEEVGVSRLVKENCDMLVKIPMIGNVQSLNASVSAGILIYEVVRQNGKKS